ncbi:MAG: type IX secretion system sortase PorU [Bacteroidota bacterium]|nr:type IX secretion system sortase PorU [Bacteroidota bacterium]
MNKKGINIFYVAISVLLTSIGYSQNISYKRTINWQKPQILKISDSRTVQLLRFQNVAYDFHYGYAPVYLENVNFSSNIGIPEATISDEIYLPLTSNEQRSIKEFKNIGYSTKIITEIIHQRENSFVRVKLLPFRVNKLNGSIEKLMSFKLNLKNSSANIPGKLKKSSYASNSVLASGKWYKVAVNKDGIYKITYQELQSLGIDPSSINPKYIRIYGNGGGMLPQNNSASRPDDLIENPIVVSGEDDGKFDSQDYILFYGQSPDRWTYNSGDNHFHHSKNIYSDYAYYFLNFDIGAGKRVSTIDNSALIATKTINYFDDYAFHEINSQNLISSGRNWYGEKFDILTDYTFQFSFPNIDVNSKVYLKTSVIAQSPYTSSFRISANGNIQAVSLTPVSTPPEYDTDFASEGNTEGSFNTSSSQINVNVHYNKTSSDALGWLDYIELNARRALVMSGSQMTFRDFNSVAANSISEFQISTSNPKLQVWDVTDLSSIGSLKTLVNSTSVFFRAKTDVLKEFIAFDSTQFYSVSLIGSVENQNLHGLTQPAMIIVSYPDFISQAQRLADFHQQNDNLKVVVVTPQQIYNEFSSGAQDVTAIRDFLRMFYERATSDESKPKYLLLFGDASYDYKNIISGNTNYVPSYESNNSISPVSSFVSDDFFGLLDPGEGDEVDGSLSGTLDIGIGRMVIKSNDEAKSAVDKVIRYKTKRDLLSGSIGNEISNYADWRNILCFIADDKDSNTHETQADKLTTYIDSTYRQFDIDKIYLDAYKMVSTPGGERYPDVNNAINHRVEKGALIVNYIGHGGVNGLSHEEVVTLADINGWKNYYNMPLFVTATCEFTRFDDPSKTSAGELVFLNSKGGGIALFTTTRIAFSSVNEYINNAFYKYIFDTINGNDGYINLGDVVRLTKNATGGSSTSNNFTLIGDPAMSLAYPTYSIKTNFVNKKSVNSSADTLKALSKVTISGYVCDGNGVKLNNFNGTLYPTVYDKKSVDSTLVNDPLNSFPFGFIVRDKILYKGKVSVNNGDFTFTFIVPKDIKYNYGFGRISYYAKNLTQDARGYFENVIIGGINKNASISNKGPDIKLYMNDTKFVFGGITDENPVMLALVSDSNGINTVGNGIGHDITAVFDNNTSGSVILNDYYSYDLNSYKNGTITYPLKNLSEGTHNIRLKVWDVFNNSGESYTEFVVAKSADIALSHVLNYPNPFSTHTQFLFEHNRPGNNLDVQIQIYTISGRLIKTLHSVVQTNGYRADPIDWDGLDDYGQKMGKGVYVYRLKVRSLLDNSSFSKYEKLVILN